MSKINSILSARLKTDAAQPKMAALAKKTAEGGLTSFSGMFGVNELTESEREKLSALLQSYAHESQEIAGDLRTLSAITSEVKAITNQAAILHGERIKRAQTILKSYREGAFTAWLMAAYGNRQTPYNFLQYFEFYAAMPKNLHSVIEKMPRQAVYTLASREGTLDAKEDIVRNSSGQSKEELLLSIREAFPLPERDKRRQNAGQRAISHLTQVRLFLQRHARHLQTGQKEAIYEELEKIRGLIGLSTQHPGTRS